MSPNARRALLTNPLARFASALVVGVAAAAALHHLYMRLFFVNLDRAWQTPTWTAEFQDLGWAVYVTLVGLVVGAFRPPAAFATGACAGIVAFLLQMDLSDEAASGFLMSRLGMSWLLRDGLVVGLAAVAGAQIVSSWRSRRLPGDPA